MSDQYAKRRQEVLRSLHERGLDCLLVTHPPNWYYLTGFTGESGALVVSGGATTLVTDGRFTVQAKEEAPGVRVELQQGALYAALGEFLRKRGMKRIGFDPGQWTVAQLKVTRKVAGAKCRVVEAGGIVEQLRPGVREREIAAEIEYQLKQRGASGPSFETIVASGARSALPHARPTGKRLRKNELVVLDLGAILGHYCSDMTRTVYLGRAPKRVRDWYRAVEEAQAAGVAAAKAGVICADVDAAAREVLKKNGLDGYFVHSTGHGLGLEVHEEPRVAKGQTIRLEAGNVITIEPGVYVEGAGGIRIEDDVVVQAGKSEMLTRVKRDLIEI